MPIFDDWDSDTTIDEAIGQAIGAASGCWNNLDGAGRFDTTKAIDIATELVEFINNRFGAKPQDVDVAVNPQEPYLGCATTEELFRELIARFAILPDGRYIGLQAKIDNALGLSEMLGGLSGPEKEYRTVGSY